MDGEKSETPIIDMRADLNCRFERVIFQNSNEKTRTLKLKKYVDNVPWWQCNLSVEIESKSQSAPLIAEGSWLSQCEKKAN